MVVEKNTWLVRWEHVDGTIRVTNTTEKTKEETLEVYPGRKKENEKRKEKQVRIF